MAGCLVRAKRRIKAARISTARTRADVRSSCSVSRTAAGGTVPSSRKGSRRCLRRDQPGLCRIQAAIHVVHAATHRAHRPTEHTDWPRILSLH
jgi:predicted RNA polymerase sigma factor